MSDGDRQLRFDLAYREVVTLFDGTRATLRLLRPDDKDYLVRGFAQLSPESRYRRFLGAKGALTPSELRYLTEIDGVRHLAIGAVTPGPNGVDEGIGIARYVALENEPTVAEAAITVVDTHQHQGLGRILLQRLVDAARERGITAFRAHVLADNAPMRALLRQVAPNAIEHTEGDELTLEIPLEPQPATTTSGEWVNVLERLLSLAAQRAFVLLSSVRGVLTPTGESAPVRGREPNEKERPMRLSARNQLVGTVRALTGDGVTVEVVVALDGGQEVVSVITAASAQRLGIVVGGKVVAVVKATDVMLGIE